ncbi:MAG TPA: redox-sensing transcriptional repressor Rex, partial [Solirubrobacterales bacterium]|nr:redox-sensing transcriptional repressor Rex [Solirubrobacterales bacterium]
MTTRPVPDATVSRLPLYLRVLVELADQGEATVSSDVLADAAGVSSANVRKDLSHLGSYGTRGIGYDVAHLIHEIRQALGLTQHWSILIAGVGNLGQALARYKGFAERGFRVAALIDVDPAKVGSRLDGMQVRHLDDLP